MKRATILMLMLAGCTPAVTEEGCPIYASEMMQAYTDACIRAYYEERARMNGGTVTRCFGGPNDMTCVTE